MFTNGGMAIASFSIAVNKRKKNGDQWEDEAHYFDCTLFGKAAESIEGWLKKGKQVAVQGELRQSRWEQDGQNRSKIEIVANSVQLLASPGDNKMDPSAPLPEQQRLHSAHKHQAALPQHHLQAHRRPEALSRSPRMIQDGAPELGPEQFDDDQIPF